ncbi:MAG: hypothetical protein ABIH99_00960 [Candidatus Micrarchaeota archaeon]
MSALKASTQAMWEKKMTSVNALKLTRCSNCYSQEDALKKFQNAPGNKREFLLPSVFFKYFRGEIGESCFFGTLVGYAKKGNGFGKVLEAKNEYTGRTIVIDGIPSSAEIKVWSSVGAETYEDRLEINPQTERKRELVLAVNPVKVDGDELILDENGKLIWQYEVKVEGDRTVFSIAENAAVFHELMRDERGETHARSGLPFWKSLLGSRDDVQMVVSEDAFAGLVVFEGRRNNRYYFNATYNYGVLHKLAVLSEKRGV